MKTKRVLAGVTATIGLLAGSGALAVDQSFTVNLTIEAACVVGAGSDMTFTTSGYLTSASLDADGTFMVGCTKGTQPTITLNDGLNSVNCPAGGTRCMKRGATSDYVNYDLYTDDGRTTAWTSALSTTPVTGTGALAGGAPDADQTVTVYGRVPPQDTPGPGAYTDTVTATVTF